MRGWFKVDRVILTDGPWEDVTTFRLYIWLIANATYMKGTKKGIMELDIAKHRKTVRSAHSLFFLKRKLG